MINIDNSYYDLEDRYCELTVDEVGFFEDTVSVIKKALSLEIDIFSCNHEREHKGSKGKEALGCFYTSDLDDLAKDCFITIDNFFIHECYEEKYHGAFNLNFTSLEAVICHEIAHAKKFRHGKTHTRIAEELLQKVQEYTREQEGSKGAMDCIDSKIAQAKEKSKKGTGKEMVTRRQQDREGH